LFELLIIIFIFTFLFQVMAFLCNSPKQSCHSDWRWNWYWKSTLKSSSLGLRPHYSFVQPCGSVQVTLELELEPTETFSHYSFSRQQSLCAKSKFYFSLCLSYPDCLPEAHTLIHQCRSEVTLRYSHKMETRTTQQNMFDKCSNMSQPDGQCLK
jgi:hypothetical protein